MIAARFSYHILILFLLQDWWVAIVYFVQPRWYLLVAESRWFNVNRNFYFLLQLVVSRKLAIILLHIDFQWTFTFNKHRFCNFKTCFWLNAETTGKLFVCLLYSSHIWKQSITLYFELCRFILIQPNPFQFLNILVQFCT